MRIPRFVAVFLCSGGALLVVALLKALLFGGLSTLPPARILVFAASSFGLVAAGIDWALLRDLFRPRRASEESYAPDPRLRHADWRNQALELPPASDSSGSRAVGEDRAESPAGPVLSSAAVIRKARMQPIVFKEICPPPASGLSFYGGVPVAPADFSWPRARNKPERAALSFVMQWDCSELAVQDATGLLPRDGVLYLFCDLTWGEPFDFQFVYAAGSSSDWQLQQMPQDLPAVYGEQGVHLVPYCSPRVEKRAQDVPNLLPRWPFAPTAFHYPDPRSDTDVDRRFWNEGDAVSEALLEVQHPMGSPGAQSLPGQKLPFSRPFSIFPHDWAAVRIVAAELLQRLHYPPPSLLRDRFEHDRKTTLQRWADNMAGLYTSATSHVPAAALQQSASDKIWRRIEEMAPALEQGWDSLVLECVNTSLGIGSEASSELPADLTALCARRHELASIYFGNGQQESEVSAAEGGPVQVRKIHAPRPNHMFGPPSFVQGHVEEYVDDWVLLLELSSRKQIGHEFGEGVYQFMIRPAHLRERQFDRVKLIASAY